MPLNVWGVARALEMNRLGGSLVWRKQQQPEMPAWKCWLVASVCQAGEVCNRLKNIHQA